MSDTSTQLATFGGGCFWCTEAVFQQLRGVHSVESGYAGGQVDDPTYEQVCQGTTGHAEVVRISFDANEISFSDLLDVFFATHDPTTPDRQGADAGTQYRSVIFFHDEQQKAVAEESLRAVDASGEFSNPVVTAIAPLERFYTAEQYHQDFFERNPGQPYCAAVIGPKMEKLRQRFADKLK